MSNKTQAIIFAVLAVVFLFLNFTESRGTLYLILAVGCGLIAGYFASRPSAK